MLAVRDAFPVRFVCAILKEKRQLPIRGGLRRKDSGMKRKNILLGVREAGEEGSVSMALYYYVMESASGKIPVYGIGIVKRVKGEKTEEEWIPGISHSRETVERLLEKMMAACVTPVSAVAVVDDCVGAGCGG